MFWGDGYETRDWIYVDDAVSLMVNLVGAYDIPAVINCGSGVSYTIKQILVMLKDKLNSSVSIEFNNEVRKGDPRYYLADIGLAKSLGWFPETCIEDGIEKYANWFMSQV